MTGLFITFEGIDKSGKSTQANLLAERLIKEGREVVLTLEPGGTALGRNIRKLLLDQQSQRRVMPTAEMLLFAADRAQHVEEVIRPSLKAGKIVISDRFVESTLAYQGYGRGLNIDLLKYVQEIATDGLTPDLTVLVDVDVATFRSRMGRSDRMEEGSDFLFEQIRQGYLNLQIADSGRILSFDGTTDLNTLSDKIYKEVERRLKQS